MMSDTRILVKAEAVSILNRVKEALPAANATIKATDAYHQLDDGSYSALYTRYYVEVSIRDAKTGNGETRVIDETGADVEAIVAEMARRLKGFAKRTRKTIAVEREMDRE